ncbi:MAG TPA: hypothetical protein VNX47_07690 [Nevskia sp.]|jgi:hypothetical protein|nr:hypothetical protein [Nevskia sp.]
MSTTRAARPQGNGKAAGMDVKGHSAQARKLAAVILEVLAGLRTVSDAASAVELSLPRYYACELRALQGLVAACEPQPRGRQPAVATELAALKRRCEQLQKQCVRQQSLLRLAQRGIGLSPATPPANKPGKGKRRRRPRLRALKAIEQLRPPADEVSAAAAASGSEAVS